jgi:hypothetical protein
MLTGTQGLQERNTRKLGVVCICFQAINLPMQLPNQKPIRFWKCGHFCVVWSPEVMSIPRDWRAKVLYQVRALTWSFGEEEE